MNETNEVKNALKEGNVIIGEDRTLKLVREGKIRRVFLASNAKQSLKADLNHYSGLSQIEIINLNITNEDLGTLCKKPFSISILGVRA